MNKHDTDGMVQWLDPDYRSEQPLHPETSFSGRDQVVKNWSLLFEQVPDLEVDVLRHANADGELWTELRVHGRKLDGASFEYRGITVWGLRDDRVAWARFYFEPVVLEGKGIDDRMQQILD